MAQLITIHEYARRAAHRLRIASDNPDADAIIGSALIAQFNTLMSYSAEAEQFVKAHTLTDCYKPDNGVVLRRLYTALLRTEGEAHEALTKCVPEPTSKYVDSTERAEKRMYNALTRLVNSTVEDDGEFLDEHLSCIT